MAITNRTLDVTEQRRTFEFNSGLYATGLTAAICTVPFNSTLDAIRVSADGLSGAPTYAFKVQRFIAGTGFTTIGGGSSTIASTAFGTSGIMSVPLAASGSTLLNLLANDVIVMSSGAANTAAATLSVAVVIKAVADIKTQFGI